MYKKRVAVPVLALACLALSLSPAHASGGESSADPAPSRFVTGSGNYWVVPGGSQNNVTVYFECIAVAGPDASQTQIRPASENGCVLTKGGTVVGRADGASYPGPLAVTRGSASVSLDQPGQFGVCWVVSATYVLDGSQLSSQGCGQ